ncbi:sodium-coupled monocarboxylate transporter 1-like isoform X2 [Amphiura filiformis]|uniref:sodium-coupled monocarboxylate transporter 1-like isoform X2 n=1 Tax=Amphiura filiformis TaxID=82378 RepID=UPI003B212213
MTSPTKARFSSADYGVFAAMLSVSAGIGVFFALTGGRQKTTREFLMADRSMGPFPVAMSLVASFISAITFLGTPAENYIYGISFVFYGIAYILTGLAVSRSFMPVLFRIGLTSANEYLERRFNKVIRIAGMLTFFLQMVIYMGIVIYAPALALSAVTGLHLWGSVIAIGVVCTFYTTIGGMKAVLWTDVFQVTVMMMGFLAVIIQGSINVGGIGRVFDIARDSGRLDVWDFRVDPTIRHSFWSVTIGGFFTWLAVYAVNQAQVQRYLTCGKERVAQKALLLAIIGMLVVVCCACLAGIVMYANYKDCDPVNAGYIKFSDQLIPYFVMDIFGHMPGLPGLLVSAVFSAALSTVSSGLNSLAAVTGEDIVKTISPDIEEFKYTVITKLLAAFYGIIAICMAFVASTLGDILQVALSIFGMVGGPLLGLFSLGIFFPWANSKGALVGLISGLIWSFWIGIGAQIYPPEVFKPPRSTRLCPTANSTMNSTMDYDEMMNEMTTTMMYTTAAANVTVAAARPAIAQLYALSYAWYSAAAWMVTWGVGLIVSFMTGYTKPHEVDPMLICSVVDGMYCCLPERWKKHMRCGVAKYERPDDEEKAYEDGSPGKYHPVDIKDGDNQDGAPGKYRALDKDGDAPVRENGERDTMM